jgi:hypothetical protein
MAVLVEGSDASIAWVKALEHLLEAGGAGVNLNVVFRGYQRDHRVEAVLREFLSSVGLDSPKTVANTIFPAALYHPELGQPGARERLYELALTGFRVGRRDPRNSSGTYFLRLIDCPSPLGTKVNQLEEVVTRLQKELSNVGPLGSAYELGTVHAGEEVQFTGDLRIRVPGRDRRLIGFPCLSHISLTLHNRQLHLSALYRHQYFVSRAYGNYLGLALLQDFICNEAKCEPGEILCIATQASAEIGSRRGMGKRALKLLLESCIAAIEKDNS